MKKISKEKLKGNRSITISQILSNIITMSAISTGGKLKIAT